MANERFILRDSLTGKELALSTQPDEPIGWALLPGVGAYTHTFKVIEPRAIEFIKDVVAPVELEFAGKLFKGLFASRVVKADQTDVLIRVYDIRYRFDYYKHFGKYNIRRSSGDLFTLVQDFAGNALSTGSRDRYQPWSVRANGAPWTALTLSLHVLSEFLDWFAADMAAAGQAVPKPRIAVKCTDNQFIPQDIEITGDGVSSSLRSLLALAEREITVAEDGSIAVYDPREDLRTPLRVTTTGGVLSKPDLSRISPREIKVYFVRERERLVKNAPANRSVTPRNFIAPLAADIYANNVCRIPYAATINGKKYPAGSWVSHEAVVSYLASAEAGEDRLDSFNGETSLLHAMAIGGAYFSTDVWAASAYREETGGFRIPNERKMRWGSAIIESFGVYWQIAPDTFQHVYAWSADTTEFLDLAVPDGIKPEPDTATTTWAKRPSPVFTQWTDQWGYFFNIREKRRTAVSPEDSFVVNPPKASPYYVEIEDDARGVFSLRALQEASGWLRLRLLGKLNGIPDYTDPKTRGDFIALVNDPRISVASRPRMETVLTFIEGTPNHHGSMHVETVAGDPSGSVPRLELFHRIEHARFDKDNRLRNAGIISEIAKAEASVALDSFKDRPTGVITFAFDKDASWEVSGHVSSIIYSREPDGFLSVVVTCADNLSRPQVLAALPQDVRKYLQRSVLSIEGA